MTRKDTRYLQASRRLRHSTWAKEPVLPAWSMWMGLAIASPFLASLLSGAAQ